MSPDNKLKAENQHTNFL